MLRQQRVMLLIVDGAEIIRHVNVTAFALRLEVIVAKKRAHVLRLGPEGFLRIIRRGSEHLKLRAPRTRRKRSRGGERVRPKDQLSKL